jgi:hypothetical protein
MPMRNILACQIATRPKYNLKVSVDVFSLSEYLVFIYNQFFLDERSGVVLKEHFNMVNGNVKLDN